MSTADDLRKRAQIEKILESFENYFCELYKMAHDHTQGERLINAPNVEGARKELLDSIEAVKKLM